MLRKWRVSLANRNVSWSTLKREQANGSTILLNYISAFYSNSQSFANMRTSTTAQPDPSLKTKIGFISA